MNAARPVLIVGAGGHAKVLVSLLDAVGTAITGLTDTDPALHGGQVLGHPILGADDIIAHHAPDEIELVIGIGSTRTGSVRAELYDTHAARGYSFHTCIHPAAWVSPDAEVRAGAQIMAGAVVQPGCRVGKNSIINTRASVDHDCRLGDHVHIAPGAVLGGTVSIANGAHVGTGAVVIENCSIGAGALIAAGACVIRDVRDGARAAGVPAQEF